jgi:hypothetical protein
MMNMKNILKFFVAIVIFASFGSVTYAQLHIVVGTQDESSGNDPSPYTNNYRSYRVQMLYTATEIQDALDDAGVAYGSPRDIVGLSWDIVGNHAMNSLDEYTIYMGHTDSTRLFWMSYEATDEVKSAFTFDPAGTGWQYIEFDSNFEWDGVSNIIIDVCWSSSYSSVGAATYMYDDGSGEYRMLYGNSSFSNMCGAYIHSGSLSNPDLKARVRFAFECDPITVSVGADEDICNTSTLENLTGNNPESGHTGAWSVVSGSGTFTNASAYNSEVTSVGQGDNVYRWTVTKTADGCADYADLTVTNNTPTTANAGSDGTSCDGNYILEGNEPAIGTGQWTTSSSAVIDDDALYNSEVNGLSGSNAGTENTFTWTITNNGCSTSDDVVITYYYAPVASVVTSPLEDCYNSETLTLNGNDPSALTPVATGQWTLISGSGTFTDNTLYNTTVTNVGTPTNTYRWTLTRNGCSSSANLVVDNISPTNASAGSDQSISEDNTTLQGNTPNQGTGTWTVSPSDQGVVITDANDPETTVTDIPENIAFTFTWTISSGSCDDTQDAMTLVRSADLVGMVIQEDLTNNGSFIHTDDDNYFVMNGTSKSILGTGNTYTNTKLRVMGSIDFDGDISNGLFDTTEVIASHSFTINSGKTYKNFKLANYGTTTLSATSAWQNSGDWFNSTGSVVADATSTVTFNGDDLQEVTSGYDGSDNPFGNVVINQDIVTPQASNGIDLQDDMAIQDGSVLTMTNGVIAIDDADAKLIILDGAAAAVTGSYDNSWVYAVSADRCLRRYLDDVSAAEYAFPVGIDTRSNIAILTNNSLPDGAFYIDSWFISSPTNPNTSFPSDLEETSTAFRYDLVVENGTWALDPTGSIDGTYDLELYFDGFAGLSSDDDNEFCIIKRSLGSSDGSSWAIPPTNSEFQGKMYSEGHAYRTAITGFSEFGIGKGNSTLPVSLLYFKGDCFENNVQLNWVTASEENNEYFTIERSYDAINFEIIATVSGAGNSLQRIEYEYIDNPKYAPAIYYRLSQTDFDGKFEVFDPIAVTCHNNPSELIVYPNPFKDAILIEGKQNGLCEVRLIDAVGKEIFNEEVWIDGKYELQTATLMPGIYALIITSSENEPSVFKMIKK